MDVSALNAFDVVVLVVVGLLGLVSLASGLTKMLLLIGAWIGAALVTLYGFGLVQPTFRGWIQTAMIADVAAGLALFAASLLAFLVVSNVLSGFVQESNLGIVDRSLGLLFGLVLGASVTSGFYMVVFEEMMTPTERPDWVMTAQTRPLLENGARILRAVMGREGIDPSTDKPAAGTLPNRAERLLHDAASAPAVGADAARRVLDRAGVLDRPAGSAPIGASAVPATRYESSRGDPAPVGQPR